MPSLPGIIASPRSLTGTARVSTRLLGFPQPKTSRRVMGNIPVIAWWDAQDMTTMSLLGVPDSGGSAFVTAWRDKAGDRVLRGTDSVSPRIFVQNGAGTTLYPTSIYLAFTNRSLSMTGPHRLPMSGECWLFTIAGFYGSTPSGVFVYGSTGPTPFYNSGRGVSINNDGTSQYPLISQGGGFLQAQHNAPARIIGGRFTDTTMELWVDGTKVNERVNIPANAYPFLSPDGILMGELMTGGGNSETRDVLITGSLTVEQRRYIEGLLAWKANKAGLLPSTHPYSAVRPPLPENL